MQHKSLNEEPQSRRERLLAAELQRLTVQLAEANAMNATRLSEVQRLATAVERAKAKAADVTKQMEEEKNSRMCSLTQTPQTCRELELAAEVERLTARLSVANATQSTQLSEIQRLPTGEEGYSAAANSKAAALTTKMHEQQEFSMQSLTQNPQTRLEQDLVEELQRLTAPLAESNAVKNNQISDIQSLTTALKEANAKAEALTTQLDQQHHFNSTFEKWKRTDWSEWEGFLAYPGRIEPFQFFPDILTMQKYIEHDEACEEECKKIFRRVFWSPESSSIEHSSASGNRRSKKEPWSTLLMQGFRGPRHALIANLGPRGCYCKPWSTLPNASL